MTSRDGVGLRSLGADVWRLLAGYGLTQAGAGFVLSYLMVYLTDARGLGLATAGLVVAAAGAAGTVALPLAGWLTDRVGASRVTAAALIVGAAGSVTFAAAHDVPTVVTASLLYGGGFAAAWNGLAALWGGAVAPALRNAVFAANNLVQNIGFGIGAAAGGLLVRAGVPGSFTPGFLGDAACRVIFAAVVLTVAASPRQPPASRPRQRNAGRLSLDRCLLRVSGVNTLVVVAGFSQVTAAFPAWASRVGGAGIVGLAMAANAFVIALVQAPVLYRVIQGRSRMKVTAGATALFATAWLLTASGLPAVLVAAMVVFGLGEALIVPVLPAVVNDLSPEALRGRYNAVFNLSWQIGPIIGPAVSGAVLAAGRGRELFLGLAAASAIAGALALGVRRLLPPAADLGADFARADTG